MSDLFNIDWHAMFVPAIGLAEVVLLGSIMYLALFAILRFIGRRQAGHFGPADLLVIVLIADAAQNALGKDYNSSPKASPWYARSSAGSMRSTGWRGAILPCGGS